MWWKTQKHLLYFMFAFIFIIDTVAYVPILHSSFAKSI